MIELAKKFVATTDEVYRLQQDDDPEAIFFQNMAKDGHYRSRKNYTQQGIYVCAPSGKLLTSINSTSPDHVLRIMQQGLAGWSRLSKDERSLADNSDIKPKHRWEDSYPEGGLDLVVFARDLPDSCDPSKPVEEKWNQDRLWYSKTETRNWLPKKIAVGAKHELPRELTERLVRFNLLDFVKGQTTSYASRDIEYASIVTQIEFVEANRVAISFSGDSRAESRFEWGDRKAYPHGVASSIMGTGVYDLSLMKFVEFEAVALGERWGKTTFNDRQRDGPSNPIGYVIRQSTKDAPLVAPANLPYYEADWIRQPK